MTGTGRSKNSSVGRQIDAEDELEVMVGYPCRNVQKVIGNIGLYAEKTTSVYSFNIEN